MRTADPAKAEQIIEAAFSFQRVELYEFGSLHSLNGSRDS
jgi:hypothetical protein